MMDGFARSLFGVKGTWDVYIHHFNEQRDPICRNIMRINHNPLKLSDPKVYVHSSEWFGYCSACGHVDEKTAFIHQFPAVPVGLRWKSDGWRCAECYGRVWWIKDEL